MTAFSDYRVNPISGASAWRTMDVETRTVAQLSAVLPGIYGFRLQDRINTAAITVVQAITGGATWTRVTTAPAAGQYFADTETGLVIFNITDDGKTFDVTYQGGGSISSMQFITDAVDDTVGSIVNATGRIIQTRYFELTSTGTLASAQIPFDDTLPQNTEGQEIPIPTATITPMFSTSKIHAEASAYFGETTDVSPAIAAALFVDSSANAIDVDAFSPGMADNPFGANLLEFKAKLFAEVTPGSTATRTFTVRIGGSSSQTLRYNGSASSRHFGGALKCYIRLTEVAG